MPAKQRWNFRNDLYLVLFFIGVVLTFESIVVFAVMLRFPYSMGMSMLIFGIGYSLMKLIAGVLAMGHGLAPWAAARKKQKR